MKESDLRFETKEGIYCDVTSLITSGSAPKTFSKPCIYHFGCVYCAHLRMLDPMIPPGGCNPAGKLLQLSSMTSLWLLKMYTSPRNPGSLYDIEYVAFLEKPRHGKYGIWAVCRNRCPWPSWHCFRTYNGYPRMLLRLPITLFDLSLDFGPWLLTTYRVQFSKGGAWLVVDQHACIANPAPRKQNAPFPQ